MKRKKIYIVLWIIVILLISSAAFASDPSDIFPSKERKCKVPPKTALEKNYVLAKETVENKNLVNNMIYNKIEE